MEGRTWEEDQQAYLIALPVLQDRRYAIVKRKSINYIRNPLRRNTRGGAIALQNGQMGRGEVWRGGLGEPVCCQPFLEDKLL
jgi:hypothetical protein